jgi:hypothetical protein
MVAALTVVLSGLFASTVTVLVTLAIEKLGGVAGGVLGTIPGTIVPASIGFALSAGSADALLASLYTFPSGMLLNVVFLLMWRELPQVKWIAGIKVFSKKLAVLIFITISAWVVMGILLLYVVQSLSTYVKPLCPAVHPTSNRAFNDLVVCVVLECPSECSV